MRFLTGCGLPIVERERVAGVLPVPDESHTTSVEVAISHAVARGVVGQDTQSGFGVGDQVVADDETLLAKHIGLGTFDADRAAASYDGAGDGVAGNRHGPALGATAVDGAAADGFSPRDSGREEVVGNGHVLDALVGRGFVTAG